MAKPPHMRKATYPGIPSPVTASVGKSATKASSYYGLSSMGPTYHPFGAQLANDLFDVHHYDYDCAEVVDDCYDYDSRVAPMKEEWEGEQFELELESLSDIENRYRNELNRMRRAYNKMSHHALKWHYLMCDVEDNPQIKKMFDDMQLMRKLSGTDNV